MHQKLAICFVVSLCCGCALPKDKSVAISERAAPVANQAVRGDESGAPSAVPDTLQTSNSQASQTAASPAASDLANDSPPAKWPASAAQGKSEWDEMMAEIDSLGNLDPLERQNLIADLRATDPALWPILMQYFRASSKGRGPSKERVTLLAETESNQASDPAASASAPAAASVPVAVSGSTEVPAQLPLPGQPIAVQMASAEESANAGGVQNALHVAPADDRNSSNHAANDRAPSQVVEPAPTDAKVGSTAARAIHEVPIHDVPIHDAPATVPPLPSGAREIGEATQDAPQTAGWQESLADAIRGLESETASDGDAKADDLEQARLRLLYLAAGRREDAMKPIPGLPPAEEEFWTKELFGLRTWLDEEQESNRQRRATAAAQELHLAAARLGQCGLLTVRNLAFCTKVASYGVYSKFEKDEFQAGQQVLLYAEIENFKSESTEKGYHTALKASCQVFDSRGSRIDGQEFPAADDYCQNSRRDFFIRYFFSMPEPLYDGKYTLRLTVEDTLNRTVGEASIDFVAKKK